jgi:hypothetical protein
VLVATFAAITNRAFATTLNNGAVTLERSMSGLSANYFLIRMGTGGLPVLGWRLGWCPIDTILIVIGIGVDVGEDS